MAIAPQTRERIERLVNDSHVVLFMKGTREAPQCGFSMQVVRLLDQLLPSYETVDVLSDPSIRDGIKEYSEWPTIPQLYVGGEFLGGCDIVKEMYGNGELHEALGVPSQGPILPKVSLSDTAAEAFRSAQKRADYKDVRIGIDARFQYSLGFGPSQPGDVVVEVSGFRLLLDPDSARRADGMRIDAEITPQGPKLAIQNPNEPKVGSITATELKDVLASGQSVQLIDVRTPEERDQALIQGSRLLDEETFHALLELSKDTLLVFHCHSGGRSQRAAQEFAQLGFTRVLNLEGGIDAWSREVDPSVPRY